MQACCNAALYSLASVWLLLRRQRRARCYAIERPLCASASTKLVNSYTSKVSVPIFLYPQVTYVRDSTKQTLGGGFFFGRTQLFVSRGLKSNAHFLSFTGLRSRCTDFPKKRLLPYDPCTPRPPDPSGRLRGTPKESGLRAFWQPHPLAPLIQIL